MPPVDSKGADKFIVLAVPMFLKPKFTVTVSAGSTTPLGQPSRTSTKLLETMMGARTGGPVSALMRFVRGGGGPPGGGGRARGAGEVGVVVGAGGAPPGGGGGGAAGGGRVGGGGAPPPGHEPHQ